VKYVPTDKLVVGIPANNFPAILADEKNTGLKAKINRKNPYSDLFWNFNAVSKNISVTKRLLNLMVLMFVCKKEIVYQFNIKG
jgi:hypothetical protein